MPSPRLPSLLAPTLAALLSCLASTDAQVPDFIGRIGLYGLPEYARSTDGYETSTFYDLQGSHAVGTSARYNAATEVGDALWVADLATASTVRIGLFSGPEFTNSANASQITDLVGWKGDAFAYGTSNRFNGAEDAGSAAWVSLTADGITKRVGLYTGAEFTSATGRQASTPDLDMAAGAYVTGGSVRYNGTSSYLGQAAWVADARTGVTTRIGFYSDPEYTLSTDGTQMSSVTGISQDGHVIGQSTRYSGAWSVGQAAWVADAATGVTTRIGLYSGMQFTSIGNGAQFSQATQINSQGQIIGYSTLYKWNQSIGQAAWVADAATGGTTRIGLYSEPGFTSATGQQNTWSIRLTESGLIFGVSDQYRYNQYSGLGQGLWVADASTGVTTRIGLYGSPDYSDPSSGFEHSDLIVSTASGYATGKSQTFDSLGNSGWAAWVADASTGITKRIGFYSGPEFASTDHGSVPESEVTGLNESGHVIGYSYRPSGRAAWVADAATGATTRVGLSAGEEFTKTGSGTQWSYFQKLTESGHIIGESYRYHGSDDAGRAAWVADASTGITTRIGLYNEPQYTQPSFNTQYSTAIDVTESGYIMGYSQRFDGESATGTAEWVAKASTGVTTRVGVFDAQHTREDGYQHGVFTALTEQGYVAGYSFRFKGMDIAGQTSWLVDLTRDTQITFELSVNSVTQESFSSITGITADGLVYGDYTLYEAGSSIGQRAFIWRKDLGTILLNEALSLAIAENGWDCLTSSYYSNGQYLLGLGQVTGLPTNSTALYVASVPEPGSVSLLVAGLGGAVVLAARRRCA